MLLLICSRLLQHFSCVYFLSLVSPHMLLKSPFPFSVLIEVLMLRLMSNFTSDWSCGHKTFTALLIWVPDCPPQDMNVYPMLLMCLKSVKHHCCSICIPGTSRPQKDICVPALCFCLKTAENSRIHLHDPRPKALHISESLCFLQMSSPRDRLLDLCQKTAW